MAKKLRWLTLILALLFCVGLGLSSNQQGIDASSMAAPGAAEYVLLAWNDLGMHCYNRDFQDLAVLPPYNTLWAQVIKRGDPPQVVTENIDVYYEFPDNTYSVGKTNFWTYDEALFGQDLPLNVGLAGKGLSGLMDLHGDHFSAEGIPLTEFQDSDLLNRYPYQLALVTARDKGSGVVLASITTVAPLSTEMTCDLCHYDGGVESIATGRVETNILTLHDLENESEYPPGHTGKLMDRKPILCAECHASNALGSSGAGDVPNLSKAMHEKHAEYVPSTLAGCYQCHPGPQTQCLRDVMASQFEMTCIDCHGDMANVAQNPNPWLIEPRCDNGACHGNGYQQDQPLYRMSKDHGGVYCAGCHDSPHAIAPSAQPNDRLKFIDLQGYYGAIAKCAVCHTEEPAEAGPHGITSPGILNKPTYLPVIERN